jgi:hypothetical protein
VNIDRRICIICEIEMNNIDKIEWMDGCIWRRGIKRRWQDKAGWIRIVFVDDDEA